MKIMMRMRMRRIGMLRRFSRIKQRVITLKKRMVEDKLSNIESIQ